MNWQPIETAPKDGTEILLHFRYSALREEPESFVSSGWWFSSPKQIDDGWLTDHGFIGEPTHWVALPKPPVPHGICP